MKPLTILCTDNRSPQFFTVTDLRQLNGVVLDGCEFAFSTTPLSKYNNLQHLLESLNIRLLLTNSDSTLVFDSWSQLGEYLLEKDITNHTLSVGYLNQSVCAMVLKGEEIEEAIERQTAAKQWSKEAKKTENLKNAAGLSKASVSSVPPIAFFALGAAMQNGADKYQKFNWRDSETTASIFYDAMMRHLNDWYNGEDFADDSKIHHLAHLMASCAIVLDSIHTGVFVDDRKGTGQSASSARDIWKSES